jgi:hypothetical protein
MQNDSVACETDIFSWYVDDTPAYAHGHRDAGPHRLDIPIYTDDHVESDPDLSTISNNRPALQTDYGRGVIKRDLGLTAQLVGGRGRCRDKQTYEKGRRAWHAWTSSAKKGASRVEGTSAFTASLTVQFSSPCRSW